MVSGLEPNPLYYLLPEDRYGKSSFGKRKLLPEILGYDALTVHAETIGFVLQE